MEYALHTKQRLTIYLDLKGPKITTNLIICYRDVKRGFEIPGAPLFTPHFESEEWQAVKNL